MITTTVQVLLLTACVFASVSRAEPIGKLHATAKVEGGTLLVWVTDGGELRGRVDAKGGQQGTSRRLHRTKDVTALQAGARGSSVWVIWATEDSNNHVAIGALHADPQLAAISSVVTVDTFTAELEDFHDVASLVTAAGDAIVAFGRDGGSRFVTRRIVAGGKVERLGTLTPTMDDEPGASGQIESLTDEGNGVRLRAFSYHGGKIEGEAFYPHRATTAPDRATTAPAK